MKRLILLIAMLSFGVMLSGDEALAQNRTIDSLINLVKTTKHDTSLVNILNDIAWEYRQTAEYERGYEYTEKAERLSKALKYTKGLARAINIKGVLYMDKGDNPRALEYYLNSLKLKEQIGDKKGIASSLFNIGIIYKKQGNYPKALETYFRSLKIREEIGDKMGIPSSLSNIGIVYMEQGNYPKALEYHQRSLKLSEELNDKKGMAASFNNIAIFYEKQGDSAIKNNDLAESGIMYDKANECFLRALELNKQVENKNGIALAFNNIGSTYHKKGNENLAIKYATEGLAISTEIKALNLIQDANRILSDAYYKANQLQKSFEHYKAYIAARDSLFNEENTKKLVQAEMNYEFEKKEQISKLAQEKNEVMHKAEVQQQRTQRNAFIAGFGLVLILAVVSFRGYKQKQKANKLLSHQKQIIEEKNKDITDSINYAQRIQQAILPSTAEIYKALQDSFIFYKPKDVVSGDFYAFAQKNNKIIIAAVDCTGHGVPGAFMSMIGNDQLNQIIIEKGITKPSEILTHLNKGIKTALKQSEGGSDTRDGMDIALCQITFLSLGEAGGGFLEYAGAHRPLYLVRNAQLMETQPDKTAIGGHTEENYVFTNHQLQIQTGDSIYLFTDGYSDQFGGDKGKKFMTKKFKELLLSIQDKSMKEQSAILEQSFETWKESYEQVDDVLVIGIRI